MQDCITTLQRNARKTVCGIESLAISLCPCSTPPSILKQNPTKRPDHVKASPAPLFHAASRRVRRELRDAYYAFVAAYREAAEKLRAGVRDVIFPRGSFPPALPFMESG